MSVFRRLIALLLLVGLVATSCSSGATDEAIERTPTSTSAVPTTTVVPTPVEPTIEATAVPTVAAMPARPYAVASANALATDAGMEVLAAGGSAIDAAVAIQAVLGLVEPQSSGLGGGAFMLYYDATSGTITAYDGREEAPSGASPTMFLDDDGNALGFFDASGSGHAVGTPGVVAMLALAHEDHGTTQWSQLFDSAIDLADAGFAISPRMGDALGLAKAFGASDAFLDLYSDDAGELLTTGDTFVNKEYAQTLTAVAEDWRALYEGDLAAEIVAAAGALPRPGTLSEADLAGYEAHRHDPLCHPFLEWTICGAPPPTSGGVAVLSLLGQLDSVDLAAAGPTTEGWHLFTEASQRAYADRDRYVGDDLFVDVPIDQLLSTEYLADRAATIDPSVASIDVSAGVIEGFPRAIDSTDEPSGTTHFVVVDAAGNVLTMTSSVETVFGSRRVAGGFVLNNQLTDFAREPSSDGELVANAIEPGKRPRSSMAPTLVLNAEGQVTLALGSPGGSGIIAYVAKVLVGTLAWDLSAGEAIALPNVVARNGTVAVETTDDSAALLDDLKELGHDARASSSEISGIHLIEIGNEGELTGAADPRREGTFRAEGS